VEAAVAALCADVMTEPKRLRGIVYGDGSFEAYRRCEDPHEEFVEVTDDEAFELIKSIEPVPDFPLDDQPPEAA
jgi:hypothetical protein